MVPAAKDEATPRYEEGILRSLRRIARALDLHSRQLIARFGLTTPQLLCLRVVAQHEGISPGAVARAVSLSHPTVTGILDRLEARGLLRRERSAFDRRVVALAVTQQGKETIARAPSPLHESFAARLAALPRDDQAVLHRTLEQVVAMLDAQDLEAAPLLHGGALPEEPGPG